MTAENKCWPVCCCMKSYRLSSSKEWDLIIQYAVIYIDDYHDDGDDEEDAEEDDRRHPFVLPSNNSIYTFPSPQCTPHRCPPPLHMAPQPAHHHHQYCHCHLLLFLLLFPLLAALFGPHRCPGPKAGACSEKKTMIVISESKRAKPLCRVALQIKCGYQLSHWSGSNSCSSRG